MSQFIWAKEAVEKLKQMAKSGLSASMIAKSLGTTRNSVIGKAQRIGTPLSRNKKPKINKIYIPRSIPKIYLKVAVGNPVKNKAFHEISSHHKPLFDLLENDCRFPVGKRMFCALPKIKYASYCEQHFLLCTHYKFEKVKSKMEATTNALSTH